MFERDNDATYIQFYANNYLYAVIHDDPTQQIAMAMKAQDLSIDSGIRSLNMQLAKDMRQCIDFATLNNNYIPAYICHEPYQSTNNTIQQLKYQLQQCDAASHILTLNQQISIASCCYENVSDPEYYKTVDEMNSDLFGNKTTSEEIKNTSNLIAIKLLAICFAGGCRLMFLHGEIIDIIVGIIFAVISCVLSLNAINKEEA